MSFIIGSKCVSTCDTACVEVCPVDCIHGPIDIDGAGAEVEKLREEDKLFENIQNLMFSFQIRDKKDIEKFLIEANETSLALFKKNKDFITDYVKTDEMSAKDKVKDLDLMIEAFVEEERYEDCALLVKIKNKIIKQYKNNKIKKDE